MAQAAGARQESEERAWEELSHPACFSHIARHDLSEFELGSFRPSWPAAPHCACLAGAQNLREHPQRRAYLLFVELPGMDDEDRYEAVPLAGAHARAAWPGAGAVGG